MTLDATTAQIASTLVLAAITTHLLLTTVLQHDTRAGRIVSVAYVTVTGTGVLTASLPGDGTEPVLGAVAAAGVTLSFGLLRAGLRLQQLGTTPGVVPALGAAAVTGLSVLLPSPSADLPVPLALAVVLSGAFAVTTVLDSLRGPAADRPAPRVLQSVMGLVALSIFVASVLIVVGAVDWDESIDVIVAMGTTIAFTLAALCVTSLRSDDLKVTWWGDDARGSIADFDLPDATTFRRDARDRIERSRTSGAAVGLVWIEIDDLGDLAAAFGPAVRDRALVHVGTVLRDHVPPFAVLGHLGGGRFAVLTTARARRPVDRVANAVRTGLAQRPDDLPLQVGCRIGTSVRGPATADLDGLLADAQSGARASAAANLSQS